MDFFSQIQFKIQYFKIEKMSTTEQSNYIENKLCIFRVISINDQVIDYICTLRF